jgi:phosphoglycerol transferase MdoB-like AlkP superfamily enzyme
MTKSDDNSWLRKIFPRALWSRRFTIIWAGCFATVLAFDLLWSMATSFRGLGFASTYIFGATLALAMAAPAAIWRSRWPSAIILVAADLLAIANLMYCRTYFGPIPPASYLLGGNVAEFGDAIRHSLRLSDLVFPAITILTLLLSTVKSIDSPEPPARKRLKATLAALAAGVAACQACGALQGGGVLSHITHLKEECYYRATPPVAYTLPVSILADLLESNRPISDQELADARQWLREGDMLRSEPAANLAYKPGNVVMIIVESLEAWPLGKSVEGQEITPCLNRLLADTATTWMAPRVLSQVGPGRSIDGQLLMTTGLLPMADYVYSMRFPDHTYPHLAQTLRADSGMKSYLLSGDRATTWNQGAVAKSFGIDETRFRDSWDSSESFGHPRNPSDGSFLRQVADCMKKGEIWPEGERALVEVITYSSHFPFTIPEEHRRLRLSADYPAPLGDYMTAINYTDHAVGEFISYLRSRSDAAETMIVIVGDHEGLASWRDPIRAACPQLASLVDAESFVPMIVVNSPVAGRYEPVMGQVDIYPTILDLAGIPHTQGIFPGLGFSALSPSAPGAAIDITGRMTGASDSIPAAMADHLRRSYGVSSTIIRADMLR